MKHVFLIDEHISSKQNGVGTYIRYFLQYFEETECQVNLMSFNSDCKELRISEELNIRQYDIPICCQGNFLKAGNLVWPLLSLYIADSKDNVFFVNHSPCMNFLNAIRINFPKSKIVFTIHDQGWTEPLLGNVANFHKVLNRQMVSNIGKRTAQFVRKYSNEEKKMYNIADAIICLSRTTLQLLQDSYGIPKEKLHYIPNCICNNGKTSTLSKPEAKKLLHIGCDEQVLLYVGRTTKAKGILALLESFEQMCHKHNHLRLVIAGEVRNINNLTKLTPYSAAHITYTGLIQSELLNTWYSAADIGILPSYTEQCSYTLLEMMQRIGIVVTTDGWGIKDMLQKKGCAFIAPIGNTSNDFVHNICDSLQKALKLSPIDIKDRQEKCQDILAEEYNINNIKERYLTLINKITT